MRSTTLFDLLTRSRRLLLVAVCLLGLLVPVYLGGVAGLDLVLSIQPGTLLALVLLMVVTWHFNLLRWYLLYANRPAALSYGYAIRAYLAMDFFIKTLPAGTGAPLAVVYYLRPFAVPAHRALALLAVEALLAGLSLLGALAVMMTASAGEGVGFRWAFGVLLPGVALLIYLLWWGFRRHRAAIRVLGRGLAAVGVPTRWRARLYRALLQLHRALVDLSQVSRWKLVVCLLTGIMMWLMYLSVMSLVAASLGASLGWSDGGLIQAVSMGLGHLLMVPGAAIGSEAAGAALLTPQLGPALAASVIIAWRFLTFYLNVAVGALAALSLAHSPLFDPGNTPAGH